MPANLTPEYGTTFTYGFVYSPTWAEGLDLTPLTATRREIPAATPVG